MLTEASRWFCFQSICAIYIIHLTFYANLPGAGHFGYQSRSLTVAKLNEAELCSYIAIPNWRAFSRCANEDENELKVVPSDFFAFEVVTCGRFRFRD